MKVRGEGRERGGHRVRDRDGGQDGMCLSASEGGRRGEGRVEEEKD